MRATLARRRRGEHRVDEWGLDEDLTGLVAPVAALRWNVTVEGGDHLPATGPVAVVVDRRLVLSVPVVVAVAVRRAIGRPARVTGVPDLAPIGPALRRLGGVLARPDEVRGLLRAGSLVVVPADAALVEPALETGAAVVPCRARGHELGWRWTVAFGAPVEPMGRGPLAALDVVDTVREG